MKRYATVLTIAGSDSGGGAGIQADIKAASACGAYAASAITALTAQNTLGVTGIHIPPAESVRAQVEAVLSDIGADAVKLGMLPTPEIVDIVADAIIEYGIREVVLDPVMIATSGDRLVSDEAIEKIKSRIIPLSRLVTPNIPETEFITGIKPDDEDSYRAAAQEFKKLGARAVLIKSGHAVADETADYLFDLEAGRTYVYPYRKIRTPNTHGTGCTLSSSIAAFLARGFTLSEAVERAEEYMRGAIAAGAEYRIGKGHGGVDHFFQLRTGGIK